MGLDILTIDVFYLLPTAFAAVCALHASGLRQPVFEAELLEAPNNCMDAQDIRKTEGLNGQKTGTLPEETILGGVGIKVSSILGAVFNLNQLPHYLHWGFIQISWANLGVILGMLVLFVAAILLPFPGRRGR